ncbi:diguanylate cyclase [Loktanella agnita]|uniref:GGDEF domain-containing protein n=1 Tax=Loktanella agnita TaxID=287097 RepID=UPI003988159F
MMIETSLIEPLPRRRVSDKPRVTGTYARPVVIARRYLGACAIIFVLLTTAANFGYLPEAFDLGPAGAATSAMTTLALLLLGVAFLLLRPGKSLSFWWKFPTIVVVMILLDSLATLWQPDRLPLLVQTLNERVSALFGISAAGNMGGDTGLILLALSIAVLTRNLYRNLSFGAAIFATVMTFNGFVTLVNEVSFFGGHMAWSTALTLLPLSLAALTLHTRHSMLRLVLQKNQIGCRLRWQIAAGALIPLLAAVYFRMSADLSMMDRQIDAALITIISWSIILAAFRSARIDSEARHVRHKLLINMSGKMITDTLTEVLNRRGLEKMLEDRWARFQHKQCKVAVLMLDLDHFKAINDTYGHLAGDYVLSQVGKVLRDNLRIEDCAGRWGGDEFMVLLKIEKRADVIAMAERVRNAVQQIRLPRSSDGPGGAELLGVRITASCGISAFRSGDRDFRDALKRADEALYQAKHAGRNLIKVDLSTLNAA